MRGTQQITILEDNQIEELVLLVNSAYRGESSKEGWTTEAHLLDGIRTDMQAITSLKSAPGSVILVYRDAESSLRGCVYLHKQQARLYLGMLTVSPRLQGQGIGRQLLNAAEAYAVNNECQSIEMTVIDSRTELIAWYKRHGYFPTGETKPFPDDPAFGIPKQPLQFVVLEKKID